MYPGWWRTGGTGRVLYRVLPSRRPEAELRTILRLIGSYGRLTGIYLKLYWFLGAGPGSGHLGPGSGPGSGPG